MMMVMMMVMQGVGRVIKGVDIGAGVHTALRNIFCFNHIYEV